MWHVAAAIDNAASLIGEFTFDANLTSCGTLDAAVTAALAADFGVTATVAQSMHVMAFFLSDTTTGGTSSNGTLPQIPSQRSVSGVLN